MPIGAHKFGSDPLPNKTIFLAFSWLQATSKWVGPVSFPKIKQASPDMYAKSLKLVFPIKLYTPQVGMDHLYSLVTHPLPA